ncbi:hypothetical protein C8T65DRAFT_693821 [Cerioporus squamosus]|nr:hypothetical protein C8T65DRAFT_693821 [Cerioporus squamosus]
MHYKVGAARIMEDRSGIMRGQPCREPAEVMFHMGGRPSLGGPSASLKRVYITLTFRSADVTVVLVPANHTQPAKATSRHVFCIGVDLTRRLPVEILAEIFVTLKHGDGNKPYGFHSPWVRVTWVCARWREIAVNTPFLWTSVAIQGHGALLDKTRTLLERAGTCPLQLYVDLQKFKHADIRGVFDAVRLLGNVVGALQIRYLHHSSREVHSGLRRLGKHRLTSLELLCHGTIRTPYRWEFSPSEFPALHSLTMRSALPIASGSLVHLRQLTLEAIDPAEGEDSGYLYEFLRCSPSLRGLSLSDAFVDTLTESYINRSIPAVTSPHLHSLRIDGPLLGSAAFLKHLRLPALRLLCIDGYTDAVVGDDVFHDIFPSNSGEALPLLSRTNSLVLRFGSSRYEGNIIHVGGTRMEAQAGDPDKHRYEWSVSIPCQCIFDDNDDNDDGGEYLREQYAGLVSHLPPLLNCAHMNHLELHVAHGLPVTRDWTRWLTQFPRLQSLTLGCGALIKEVLHHLRNDRKHELLPRMKKLKLCLCKFDDGSTTVFSQADFCEWLRHRHALRLSLSELTIRIPTNRPASQHYLLNLGHMIAAQVSSFETGIEREGVRILTKEQSYSSIDTIDERLPLFACAKPDIPDALCDSSRRDKHAKRQKKRRIKSRRFQLPPSLTSPYTGTALPLADIMQLRDHDLVLMAPAAELPPKVLEKIFLALQAESISDVSPCDDSGFRAPWVQAATWVCHRWREVALTTPKLWSTIRISSRTCEPEAIDTLIKRAGDEDLEVFVDGLGLDMPKACALVQPHGQRVSVLSVDFDEVQAATVQVLLMHMGPRLGNLQLYCDMPAAEHGLVLDPETVPSLHTLVVRHIYVQPKAEMGSLTELTLEQLWGAGEKEQRGQLLYTILAMCPNLEILDLTDAMPRADHLDPDTTPTLEFSKMRSMVVNELAIDLPANLAHFKLPASAELLITARYDSCPPEWDDETTVLPMNVLPGNQHENFPMFGDETIDLSLTLGARCCLPDIMVQGGNWSINIPTMEDEAESVNRLPEFVIHVLDGLPDIVLRPQNIKFLDLHISQHLPDFDDWAALLSERAFNAVVGALNTYKEELLPKLFQLTACIAVKIDVNTKADARAFGALLVERANVGKLLKSLIVKVPEMPLNDATIRLAGSLVAHMALRGGRVRVERKACIACHGKHEH